MVGPLGSPRDSGLEPHVEEGGVESSRDGAGADARRCGGLGSRRVAGGVRGDSGARARRAVVRGQNRRHGHRGPSARVVDGNLGLAQADVGRGEGGPEIGEAVDAAPERTASAAGGGALGGSPAGPMGYNIHYLQATLGEPRVYGRVQGFRV